MHKIIGINERSYPSQSTNGWARVDISVVLVEGDIGYYAAYAGQGSPEWIADHGDKISFKEATVHFPGGQLEKEKYRG